MRLLDSTQQLLNIIDTILAYKIRQRSLQNVFYCTQFHSKFKWLIASMTTASHDQVASEHC